MTEPELLQLLEWIDSALEVYHSHKGGLGAGEIRAGSMLLVVREAIAEDLRKMGYRVPRAQNLRKQPVED